MKRKRHTPEEIIKKLREAATLLAAGQSVEEACKKLEVSPPTYHRWKEQLWRGKGGDDQAAAAFGKGERQLKKLVADQALDLSLLKELNEGKW